MSLNHLNVPKNMSPVNAFYALWGSAEMEETFVEKPHLAAQEKKVVDTSEKVAALISSNPNISYAGGKKIFVNFRNFPRLDISGYDRIHGEGAAERRLTSYHRTPSSERFDKGDRFLNLFFARAKL